MCPTYIAEGPPSEVGATGIAQFPSKSQVKVLLIAMVAAVSTEVAASQASVKRLDSAQAFAATVQSRSRAAVESW